MKNSKMKMLMLIMAGLLVFASLPQAVMANNINPTTVLAWGLNDYGQSSVPTGLADAQAIAAGEYHTVALKADGSVMVQEQFIFCNWNHGGVYSGVGKSPSFTIAEPYALTFIDTYHWFGYGQPAGTISVVHEDGTIYGPWTTQLFYGSTWVHNFENPAEFKDFFGTPLGTVAYSDDYPILKPGNYTVIDSNPGTWSFNASSGYYGFSQIRGYKLSDVPEATLASIAITNPATKLSYQIGEALDLTGLEVTGTYSDGSTKIEAVTAANITGFDNSSAFADQLLTITVGDVFTNYTVQILPATISTSVVTFNTGGGTPVPDSQIVAEGAVATEPATPTKAGLSFSGWYQDAALTTPFDFTTPITSDTVLYAKWTAALSFETNGGTPVPDSQIVNEGATAIEPAAPTKTGFAFGGWYQDGQSTAFNFATPITSDMTLNARWLSPSDLIAQLRAYVIDNTANGNIKLGNSLIAKLDNIADKVDRGDTQAALNQLEAFINEVMAQQGKNIENETANQLIQKAQLIRSMLRQD